MSDNQSEETHQRINPRQLVVLVRYKPGGLDMASAGSMVGKLTNPIEGAVSAIESAAASIPGLNMFIKEEKKETSSEKEYTYFKDYSAWDKLMTTIKKGLLEMNPDSAVETFEFDSTDADGRKKAGKDLLDKVNSKIAGWKKYTSYIHFIGLGQGGNVANECATLLAADSTFKAEKWNVQSLIYVGTPLYEDKHKPDEASLKGSGGKFAFGNRYDLTQAVVACFDDSEKLLTLIKDSNKNVLSLAIGKLKLRLVKILAVVLSGLHIDVGPDALDDLNKIDTIKEEIKGLIDDILGFIDKLIGEGTSFIKLDEIPEFSGIADGYPQIPDKCVKMIEAWLKEVKDKTVDGAKHANLSLGPQDLAGVLNCLCPLFDAISQSLAVFKPGTKGAEKLAQQIVEKSGISKIYKPGETPAYLDIDTAQIQKAKDMADKNEPDMSVVLIAKVRGLLASAAEKGNDVKSLGAAQKAQLAEAIGCLTLPMLPSKKEFYAKLINALPFDLKALSERYNAGALAGMAKSPLGSIGILFPEKLSTSIANMDKEIDRIRGYFDKNNFKMPDKIDTLYLAYNSHNLMLAKVPGPVAQCIDTQTGYLSFMKSKGYDNECTMEANKYKQGGKEIKPDALPTQPVTQST